MIHEYFISFVTYVAIYVIAVLAFNLAAGFTGLVNLGHMVFFGIGAYSSALLTINGVPWAIAIILSALIASVIATLIAAITVRLKGDYFQIVTLGLVFMAIAISRSWESLTRGALGIPGVPDIIKDNFLYMLFVSAISIGCIYFFNWLTKIETGKIFQAIRDDEIAVQVLGKNTYYYKVLSISISTFFAGLAGSLFIHHINFIDPTVFDLDFFVTILSMMIVGGLASIKGSIIGTAALTAVGQLVKFIPLNPDIVGAMRHMIYIAILLIILVYRPRGIFGKVDV